MAAKEADQQFVEYVVSQLVSKPESVATERKIDELGVLIELTVDREDMGVVIGKEGKTAKAIRTLLRVFGAKNDSRTEKPFPCGPVILIRSPTFLSFSTLVPLPFIKYRNLILPVFVSVS